MILDDDKVKLGRVDSSSPSLDSSKSQYIIKGGSGCAGYCFNGNSHKLSDKKRILKIGQKLTEIKTKMRNLLWMIIKY